jgi:hypothetical protein
MIDDDEGVYTIVCFKCRKPFQLADPYLQVRAYGDPDGTVYWMHVQCPKEAAKS